MSFSSERRRCLSTLTAFAMSLTVQISRAGTAVLNGVPQGHGYFYPPLSLPDFAVIDQHGKTHRFHDMLRGHVTALQLIFTGCSNVCPMQGATFRQLQDLFSNQDKRKMQLLSLSLDPLNDSPQALQSWLQRFEPVAGWVALSPSLKASDVVRNTFNEGRAELNSHLTDVYLFDTQARLVWRSPELPSAESLASKMLAIAH